LPDRNGRTIQLYGYDLLAANTTPGAEGTVGTGINPTTSVRNTTVNQFFDFASFSDILVETAIDPIVENTAAEMGFRAALTANTLARLEFEAEATADTTIVISGTDNEFLSASLVRQGVFSLRGADVRPMSDGMFPGIIHPFPGYDLMNDNTAGGVIDVLKYHKEGSEELQRGVQGYRVIDISGIRFIETTTTSTFTNFPSSGKTGYGTYIIGQDAVFSVSLGATEIPEQRNYQIIVRNWEPSSADPARLVGASCAYNFKYGVLRVPQAASLHPRFNGAVQWKRCNEKPENSVNVSDSRKHRAEPLQFGGTCRDYAPATLTLGQEIVRPARRRAEVGRNDQPAAWQLAA
jgi:N4-gp56 family major capsid protein